MDRSAGHYYFRNVVQRPPNGDGSPHGFRSFAGPAPPMGQTVEVDGDDGDDPLRLRTYNPWYIGNFVQIPLEGPLGYELA